MLALHHMIMYVGVHGSAVHFHRLTGDRSIIFKFPITDIKCQIINNRLLIISLSYIKKSE